MPSNTTARYQFFRDARLDSNDPLIIERKYDEGYVLTRLGKTIMRQVRSVRVPLKQFQLSSENRRLIKNFPHVALRHIPRNAFSYHWKIGKMAKDFYARFGTRVFSANKIKELCTSPSSPLHAVLEYRDDRGMPVGYCLIFETSTLVHYAYPFYDIARKDPIGMVMMTKALVWAQEQGKRSMYLGSIQNEKSLYKFQFKGVEWFDGKQWQQGKPKFLIPNS